ncbi:MAG: penicillin-binding transpeptidase domain-containing protein, partial [Anaerolineae bacterium]|nr:penicillin-binding transpeptidase domain-containing protein [Anaerolineae bacterium]
MDHKWRNRRLQHLSVAVLTAFLAVFLALAYWTVLRGTALSERQDNPRRVEAELRIRRGRILDSEGAVLAETVGPLQAPQRVYAVSTIGPAVGYYSFRYGTAGVEEGFDAILRGNSESAWRALWRHSLHEVQRGRDIRLTLNADWQRQASALLGERRGAIVLLTLPEGAIAAMASSPGYDPNRLDEQFEDLAGSAGAPLLNRATQGQYQPGLALQPFLLAGALDAGLIRLEDDINNADRAIVVHRQSRQCATEPPESATWRDVLQHACPAPMLTLGEEMAASEVESVLASFGLMQAPDVPLAVSEPPSATISDVESALIGQAELTVSPLQVALALAALANEGAPPAPLLVSAVQNEQGAWQSLP